MAYISVLAETMSRVLRAAEELGPVLPIFKIAEIPGELLPQLKIKPGQETADGPVFSSTVNKSQ